MNTTTKLSFTAVILKDEDLGRFTAYFKQFPSIIAEGDSEDEVLTNLLKAVHDVLQYESSQIALESNAYEKEIDLQVA